MNPARRGPTPQEWREACRKVVVFRVVAVGALTWMTVANLWDGRPAWFLAAAIHLALLPSEARSYWSARAVEKLAQNRGGQ